MLPEVLLQGCHSKCARMLSQAGAAPHAQGRVCALPWQSCLTILRYVKWLMQLGGCSGGASRNPGAAASDRAHLQRGLIPIRFDAVQPVLAWASRCLQTCC